MYFVIDESVYRGIDDRNDSEDSFIMDLPECDEWFFHANCLIIFRNFEDDRDEPQVEWVAYNLLSDNPKDEIVASIGSYANCKTGREGAMEDARREAENLDTVCQEYLLRKIGDVMANMTETTPASVADDMGLPDHIVQWLEEKNAYFVIGVEVDCQ